MSAHIVQTAKSDAWCYLNERGFQHSGGETRPATIEINGVRFSTPHPENAGEAETFNQAAAEMVTGVTRKSA